MRSSDCPHTVQFYGALCREGDVWICMEVMDTSLDKFYPRVYNNSRAIPEPILANITLAVSLGLFFNILSVSNVSISYLIIVDKILESCELSSNFFPLITFKVEINHYYLMSTIMFICYIFTTAQL